MLGSRKDPRIAGANGRGRGLRAALLAVAMVTTVLVTGIAMAVAPPAPLPAMTTGESGEAYEVLTDVRVPMDDGVRLAADVYVPTAPDRDGDGLYPCVVELTPYRKESRASEGASFLPGEGIALIEVDARGTGGSEGEYDVVFSVREQADAAAMVDWAAEQAQDAEGQPLCEDTVGMYGGSYSGIIQYLVATLPPIAQGDVPAAPEHLSAIAPQRAYGDLYRDIVYHGGQVIGSFGAIWSSGTSAYYLQPPTDVDTADGQAAWADHLTKNDPMLLPYLDNPYADASFTSDDSDTPYTQALYRDSSPLSRIEHLTVPTLHLAGWYDAFTRGQMLTFQQALAFEADPPTVLPPAQLSISATDASFTPSTLVVQAGQPVELTFTNEGANGHNWGVDLDGDGATGDDARTDTLPAGGQQTITFTAPSEPGTYTFWCDVPGHRGLGLEGTLTVEPASPDDTEPAPRGPNFMIVGPWNHGGTHFIDPDQGFDQELADWYHWFLEDEANDATAPSWITDGFGGNGERLHYFQMRSTTINPEMPPADPADGVWRDAPAWPLPSTDMQRLYLHEGGTLSGQAPGANEAPASYLYEPGSGSAETLSRWDNAAGTPQPRKDQRLEDGTGLTYTTPELTERLELAGPMVLQLHAETLGLPGQPSLADAWPGPAQTNPPYHDTDWVVKLSDVAPDGTAHLITQGYLRASHRAVDLDRSTLVDGEVVSPFHPHTLDTLDPPTQGRVTKYLVEIWPTAKTFEPGHRLRLDIASSDMPNHLNLNKPALNTVHHAAGQASYLAVPVVG